MLFCYHDGGIQTHTQIEDCADTRALPDSPLHESFAWKQTVWLAMETRLTAEAQRTERDGEI